jgi:hypothetical protein
MLATASKGVSCTLSSTGAVWASDGELSAGVFFFVILSLVSVVSEQWSVFSA